MKKKANQKYMYSNLIEQNEIKLMYVFLFFNSRTKKKPVNAMTAVKKKKKKKKNGLLANNHSRSIYNS